MRMHLSRLQVLVSPCVHADRRGVDNIADIFMRRYSLGAGVVRDIKSPLTRQPFSTISSTISSQENVENVTAESIMQKQKLQKALAINNFPFTTTATSKAETVVDEENRTPKAMPIPASTTTPRTVSIPMNMAMTPAPFGSNQVQEIEYSFEERRFGFVLV
jgi:protein regulator of cytokinesis 1